METFVWFCVLLLVMVVALTVFTGPISRGRGEAWSHHVLRRRQKGGEAAVTLSGHGDVTQRVRDAVDERFREEALRQLDSANLDDDNWRIPPIWDLEDGLTVGNHDLDDDDDAGILDWPTKRI